MKKILFLFLCALLAAPCGFSQVRVVKSADRKIQMDLSGLRVATDAASRAFFQTLENDLRNSGWFETLRGGGEIRLIGSAGLNGSSLEAVCQIYRADQTRLFSKSYSTDANQARILAHRAADDIIEAITGHKGFASCRIALVGNRTGKKELYLCDSTGQNLVQVTRDGKIVIGPDWAPDGESIIFTSFLRGFPDVYRADLKRGKRELIASYGGLNTGSSISPDGRDIALILSKDGNPELYIKNLRSGRLTRLTQTPRSVEGSPDWSPDGRHLVYVSDQSGTPQLYIIPREGGRPRRLSSRGSENVSPDWGSNGWIACASRAGGRYSISIINPSSGETRYLQTDGADYEDPSWAPDGRHLFAARSSRHQSALYLLDTLGDPPVALLQGGGSWYSPACSPR